MISSIYYCKQSKYFCVKNNYNTTQHNPIKFKTYIPALLLISTPESTIAERQSKCLFITATVRTGRPSGFSQLGLAPCRSKTKQVIIHDGYCYWTLLHLINIHDLITPFHWSILPISDKYGTLLSLGTDAETIITQPAGS